VGTGFFGYVPGCLNPGHNACSVGLGLHAAIGHRSLQYGKMKAYSHNADAVLRLSLIMLLLMLLMLMMMMMMYIAAVLSGLTQQMRNTLQYLVCAVVGAHFNHSRLHHPPVRRHRPNTTV